MKLRLNNIWLLLLLSMSATPLWSQEDLLREFNTYIHREEQTFDNHIRQMNKEFALYLKQQWVSFGTSSNEVPRIDPDKPTVKKESRPVHIREQQTETLIHKQPIPLEKASESPQSEWRTFLFFGQSLQIPYKPTYAIRLAGVDERAVSNAWSRAADVNYSFLLNISQQYKEKLQLNDWAYMQLLRQMSEVIYGESKGNNVLFLTTFLLNQSGKSARLGRVNGQLALLLEIKETIYSVPQLMCEGRLLSVFCEQPLGESMQVSTYRKQLPGAIAQTSLRLPSLPLLQGNLIARNLPHPWQGQTVRVSCNKALIDFFDTIPQTALLLYAESGSSPQIEMLADTLKRSLPEADEVKAVALLLDFVQNTFDYQSDVQQFGREKIFFPDEMLYYPYTDCEDRAILFCRLVQKLVGLKVALIDYPKHIAAAVSFRSPVSGVNYTSGKDIYTICDPTYINAGIGECMPQFIGVKAKVIKL